ncbi:GPI ethanolamine phosphate transferase 1 [Phlebotomus argentipes]|uniref:GPI ethanolamine phosphate transferase 1 n=1 Tax=Phlebotomus argentipes TaxID=94469 RepID=UPI002893080A|nr:GPI ethanolamine phosphate transferase 1 [Phlebotomus argentipes]
MYKFFLFGVVIHLIFLSSIFDIYFLSPIIRELTPQKDLENPPAKRLVLFVADGLRAESFYRDGFKMTEYLGEIVMKQGIAGISHTRVPTESRPGHVALIAGIYEDPSAVTRGWKDNPVDFDSVFNRSRVTYSWGSPDILQIFVKGGNERKHIFTHSYTTSDVDFSGKNRTVWLDEWVFSRTKEFLLRNVTDELKSQDRVIFFLHLLGLDTAGHVHKPNSRLFLKNLVVVDRGIREIVSLFENIFPDYMTSYVFTSDHGMSDRGAHGAGHHHETETPIVAWGAGVARKTSWKPLESIEQADVTPLMAALIGVAPPVNNVGMLPIQFLSVSQNYTSRALCSNALQILAQFNKVSGDFHLGKLSRYFRTFEKEQVIRDVSREIRRKIALEQYDKAIAMSHSVIKDCLQGIEFYQTYYQKLFLLTVSVAMVVWMIISFQELTSGHLEYVTRVIDCRVTVIYTILLSFTITFVILQQINFRLTLYLILPIILQFVTLKRWNYFNAIRFRTNLKFILLYAAGVELFVLAFFYRFTLAAILLIYCAIEAVQQYRKGLPKMMLVKWIVSSTILSIFPSLPVIEKDANDFQLLFIGTLLWCVHSFISFLTSFNKEVESYWEQVHKYGIIFLHLIVNINLLASVSSINEGAGLHSVYQIISWISLILALILPILSSVDPETRLWTLASSFSVPISIMSLSYEPIFFFVFSVNLITWFQMEFASHEATHQKLFLDRRDFIRMYIILLYIFVSFFGTGNFASISSFDPNWVRCLVTTFSPFLMATLIILKLMAPILLVVCVLRMIHVISKTEIRKLFIVILLICDVMGVNFFYLITNRGSWLEIGQSISHFVIIEVTVLVLLLLFFVTHPFTNLDLVTVLRNGKELLPTTKRRKIQ